MKHLHIVFLSLALLFTQLGHAQTNDKWTLEKCIDYAMQHNISVRQAALLAKVSKNDNLQSKLNVLPTVDASASYNLNFGNSLNPVTYSFIESNSQSSSLNLTGTLPLFTGLQQVYNIQRTKYELMASEFDYRAAQNDIALAVSSAYLQILLNKEIVNVLEKQQQLTLSQKTSVDSRIRSGLLSENAMYDIDAQVARDEANLVSAKGVYDVSILTLRQLLQLKPEDSFDLDIPQVDADNIEAIGGTNALGIFNFAVTNQPAIMGAQARVQSADASRKMAMGNFSPTLSAFTQLSTGYFSQDQKAIKYDTLFGQSYPSEYAKVPFGEQLGNNFRKVVGFQLSIPIFGKGQRFTNLANSKLQIQIRQLQLENAKNTLRQDIEQAYANAKAAAESYFANKKSYEAATKAYDALNKRFSSGLANEFEVQQSKNTLASAEAEMAKAKYTYVFRQKVLDFYQGKKITLN